MSGKKARKAKQFCLRTLSEVISSYIEEKKVYPSFSFPYVNARATVSNRSRTYLFKSFPISYIEGVL